MLVVRKRTAYRSRMRSKGQITVPPEIRTALHMEEGDEVEFVLDTDGRVTMRVLVSIPKDEAWFYTPEWQAGEREVDESLARGERGRVFDNADDFIEFLQGIDDELREEGR